MNNIRRVKPTLTVAQIFNMSMGFLGIQMGFALQNSNASRILQTFGADVEHLSLFWLAAPITGMIVQPIIGHYSDRTWTKMGRRRPFFLVGALLTAIALVLMPNIALFTAILPPLLIGAGMLMLMDASINVTMEPFRALVGDNLPSAQRSLGFSVQTILIGVGAVVGSWLPYVFAEYLLIPADGGDGIVPQNVIYSFYFGAFVLIATILWTVFTTKEYSPQELQSFVGEEEAEPEVQSSTNHNLGAIFQDFKQMPLTMKKLGWVQFFSWFALFMMWVYMTPAIAEHVFYKMDGERNRLYAEAGNWVGVLFGVYNGISAIYAIFLPRLANRFGRTKIHAFGLVIGGVSLISILFISSPNILLLTMLGVGIAWGSILSMPYAILSDSLPVRKMGVYMGIFNFFITFPQIICGFFGGMIIKYVFDSQPIYGIMLGGIFMLLGAISVWRIKE
ncbi:MFS transporter [Sphingobacterium sp. SGR-19]|uniref:MFS transporter n=1 Tax=Sphingobacterium sp. SGR-19 TaxID=2710886 RepID=UPI0013EDD9EB|nr:MFS transporter [Sphingobacterium sp. SGR-19]NGM63809.1 SLC45 family MFS transporter [Sphingobacterium sp. SGR-19]